MQLLLRTSYYDYENYDNDAIGLIGISLFFGGATYGIKAIVAGIGLYNAQQFASLMIYVIWAITLTKLVLKNRFIFKSIICAELIGIIIFLLNYYLFPNTQTYYTEYAMELRQVFIIYIPTIPVVRNIKNYDNFCQQLKKLSRFVIVFMTISYLLGYQSMWSRQFFGVQVSPFSLILFAIYLSNSRPSNFIWFFLSVILVLLGGRQSFLALLIGMIVLYLDGDDRKAKMKTVFVMCCTMIALFSYAFSETLLRALQWLVENFNINSRTIVLLAQGELADTSSRDIIYQGALQYIQDHPFQINGLFGDRLFIRNYHSWITFPHNIVLELMMDFGVVIGGGISLLIIYRFISRILKHDTDFLIVSIVGSVVLVRLMLSNSFLIEGMFYILLGVLWPRRKENSQIIFRMRDHKYVTVKGKEFGS